MEKQVQQSLFSTFSIALLLLSVATCQEVEDERGFSYDKNSPIGPDHWGEIREEWRICNHGRMQSPVDLRNDRVETTSELGRLHREYHPSNATLINRGHDMTLRWEGGAGHLRINGTQYRLNQCHWHGPSEHAINGRRYDLEVHLVHESTDGKIAVVGMMYKIGRPDSFLSMLRKDLQEISNTMGVEIRVGMMDPEKIKIGRGKYYRYIGSLTVPACTENVVWTIVKKVRTVTREQVRLIREAVQDEADYNARPIQAMNDRWLKLYRPRHREEN